MAFRNKSEDKISFPEIEAVRTKLMSQRTASFISEVFWVLNSVAYNNTYLLQKGTKSA